MNFAQFQKENSINQVEKRARSVTRLGVRQPLKALSPISLKPQLDSIDQKDSTDPQRIGYLATEIFGSLLSEEPSSTPSPNYMSFQPSINYKMRAILIDWLISVHLKFRMMPETLYLTVNIIDRYLEKKAVEKKVLQLVGVSALLVAAKYEEIYPPRLRDLIYITDKAYSKQQILKMESDILKALAFNVTVPSSWRFLERFSRLAELDERGFSLGRYLCELALVEYHMLRHKPSCVAAAAVYISLKLFKAKNPWPNHLVDHSKYSEESIKECAKDLLVLFQAAHKHTLTAVVSKFSKKEFYVVANITIS